MWFRLVNQFGSDDEPLKKCSAVIWRDGLYFVWAKQESPVMTFPIEKITNTEMFITWTGALYIGLRRIRDKTNERVAYFFSKSR